MQATAIIGANYGDEGKGLLTDYVCAERGMDVVVRFNGGAQAGHTVVTPDGARHVFHHIAAGAFAGTATYLSRFFVCNPILFLQELANLPQQIPVVMVDPTALVTTPYDMLLNQALEDGRGGARHGSCGVGFGETIERGLQSRYTLRVADLAQRAQLRTQLQRIRDEYLPQRLAALGLRDDGRYRGEEFIDQFLRDSEVFADCIAPRPPSVLRGKRLVFEGAQGLLLDQDNRADFPHVTRSHTGLRNVRSLAGELSIDALEVLYVSRSYLTRHGAGPLPGEAPLPDTIHDATNLAHPYQGVLRYAPLDPAALLARITADLAHGEPLALEPRLALTCLDQHPAPSLPAQLQKWLSYSAHGPTQRDVRTLTSVG